MIQTEEQNDWNSGALLWGCIGWVVIGIFLLGMIAGVVLVVILKGLVG